MRKNMLLAALFISATLAAPRLEAESEVVILAYHTFLGSKTSSLDFTTDELATQMDDLSALGYHFVSLDDFLSGQIQGSANILITIDDGNRSDYPAYTKVLAKRGIKPVLFAYPGVIGHTKFALTKEQLKKLADSGCDIGAHGYYHEYLSAKAFAKDRAKCLIEIERPARALASIVGKPIRTFAYPFGESSPEAEELLAKQGYEWAFTAGDHIAPVYLGAPSLDHYTVPRTIVYHWNFPIILRKLKSMAAVTTK
jgi:peptidoglycan/xylan/chitin deacetylase (PgdA/CDA1 family)